MVNHYTTFLMSQNWMEVIRALLSFSRPLALRELVDMTNMSPAGVQDVLRRLKEGQVVQEEKYGNKCLYELRLNKDEEVFLRKALQSKSVAMLKERAKLFSSRRESAIGWIDETMTMVQHARRSLSNSP